SLGVWHILRYTMVSEFIVLHSAREIAMTLPATFKKVVIRQTGRNPHTCLAVIDDAPTIRSYPFPHRTIQTILTALDKYR
ncbi:MAG: hypothetical protein AAFN11_21630, partial [Chloroflexota bacterium]